PPRRELRGRFRRSSLRRGLLIRSQRLIVTINDVWPWRVALYAIVTCASALTPTDTFAQSTGVCADTTNATTKYYRDYYRLAVSSTASQMVSFRNDTGLPNLTAAQVHLVADTAVCRIASTAFDAKRLNKYPVAPVIVLELGTKRMVIKDVGLTGGRLNFLFTLDFSILL